MSTKAEQFAKEVAAAVGAGKAVVSETVDFNDPNRPKTCLEVDFPILPVNQVAAIEGNAGKPIYQMSKWWARRRSSVFRSMLIAAATKAPDDASKADKVVWDAYYGNHQKKGSFRHLKVADIFMGGGTTIVEGSRLGMQMYGNDLNPVAWFVVKNELAQVDRKAVEALLADVEREVKPQIMPFYACDCPRGHKGTWTHIPTGKVMGADFDPLALTLDERPAYRYEGPEIIYVFWAKHGPCQVTRCGHRTPVLTTPVVAVKTLTVRAWENHRCANPNCRMAFDVEQSEVRMAPGVPLVVAPSEAAFATFSAKEGVTCPHCAHREQHPVLPGKGTNKKVALSLLVHPSWMKGSPRDSAGVPFGGGASDPPSATVAWNEERADKLRLLEVRGALPETVTCPVTGDTFSTQDGTVPKRSTFECGACGTAQDVLTAVKASKNMAPWGAYAYQGHCPSCARTSNPYGGRFFAGLCDVRAINAATVEWAERRDSWASGGLAQWWPRSEVPYGFMTGIANGDIRLGHGFTHWSTMFHPRQLLVHTQLLRSIMGAGSYDWEVREFVLGAFQQYLRNQCMFTLWNTAADKLEPMFANNNYHPKSTVVENCVFAPCGRGNWISCYEGILEGADWAAHPDELVAKSWLSRSHPSLGDQIGGKSARVPMNDPVLPAEIEVGSATDRERYSAGSVDLVITDPPFGGLLHYSELADFFYVWLRLVMKDRYPQVFKGEYTPKTLEVVANRARNPEDADAFYKRLLTSAWSEAGRILKPGGILAFTFHHSEDAPWVDVLESLFDAGFLLEATYPIRSDETKGSGEFGSKTIEYDIIHVCRKRLEEPKTVSWARLRRQILQEARRLEEMLSHHKKAGLPDADIAVVRRGKALEYFSKHYGKVLVEGDAVMKVKDALAGINQVLDQDAGGMVDPPPSSAAPFTWQFCRMFDMRTTLPRSEMQHYLRGTGYAPPEYEAVGWVELDEKTYKLVSPIEIARSWIGRWRAGLRGDYEQAMFLIGASFEGSGINVTDTLNNESFKPHPALAGLLEWFSRRGGDSKIRTAAGRARQLYAQWQQKHTDKVRQLTMFQDEEDAR
jgi:putative DNA methylase